MVNLDDSRLFRGHEYNVQVRRLEMLKSTVGGNPTLLNLVALQGIWLSGRGNDDHGNDNNNQG